MKKLLILLFFVVSLFAENIEKYKVIINVLQNGNLDVTEIISYNFGNLKRHGIRRFIPCFRGKYPTLKNITMDNHEVDYDTSYYSENNKDYLIIKIGNADKLISGIHTYTIHYTMERLVSKYNDNLNTIRFNAIGNGWKIPIKNIIVQLKLPPILQNATIKTFSGVYKSTSTTAEVKKIDNLNYLITMKNLPPRNGLTIGIYFDKNLIQAYKKPEPNNLWVWVFLIIFSLLNYFYYQKHKAHLGPISPQYYPPKNFDILESGVLIDEEFDDKDITAAILELATKGYLKISKENEKTILKKTSSNKELTPFLEELYNSLFKDGDTFILGEKNAETAKSIKNKISDLKSKIFEWCLKEGYFYETPLKAKIKFFILNLLVVLPFIVFAGYQTFEIDECFFMDGLILFFSMLFILIVITKLPLIIKIIFLFTPLISISVMFYYNISEILNFPFPLISLILFPLIYFSMKIDVYTPKGSKTLQYLLGFKEFIEKVEKEKIKLLLKDDPEYLDKVLPYAVLFGVNEHWLKLYSELNEKIEWYEGDIIYFNSFYDDLYDNFETTANYVETSSGDFSGGDFDGGGGGGGGGDSW